MLASAHEESSVLTFNEPVESIEVTVNKNQSITLSGTAQSPSMPCRNVQLTNSIVITAQLPVSKMSDSNVDAGQGSDPSTLDGVLATL